MISDILYNVTFETGTLPFAGTDANVFIELHGEEGSTGKIEFNRNDNKSAGRFERGRTDKFAVETTDIGKVHKMKQELARRSLKKSIEFFLKNTLLCILFFVFFQI